MARKILLADDSVTAQNMGRKILADAGYEVIAVNNGSAALKKIAELKPDIVVLDVYMPGYSGLEVCQRLKESPETSRIPVLLTVGKLEPFKPEEAQRVRAEGYIVKPFEASELLSALSKLEDKIVPRSEPTKPGRFARAMAAAEETGRGSRSDAPPAENGWKSRIAFPQPKSEAQENEEKEAAQSTYNPVNRDLRTVVETFEEKVEAKKKEDEHPQAEATVDVAAFSPAGLPKDVTPEELAAITAAAAQIQMAADAGLGGNSEDLASTSETSQEIPAVCAEASPANALTEEPAPVVQHRRRKEDRQEDQKLEDQRQEDQRREEARKEEPQEEKKEVRGDESSQEDTRHAEPVTMAAAAAASAGGGSRWTAVAVALESGEAAVSLDHEMQKMYSAFTAADLASGENAPQKMFDASIEASPVRAQSPPEESMAASAIPEAPPESVPQSEPEFVAPSPALELVRATEEERQVEPQAEVPSHQLAEPVNSYEPISEPATASPQTEAAIVSVAAETEPTPQPAEISAVLESGPAQEPNSAFAENKVAEPEAPAPAPQEPPQLEAVTPQMEVPAASSSSFAPIDREPEPKLDTETVKSSAAAWASWRQIRDTGKAGEDTQAAPPEPVSSETPSTDTNAMAVAAGAEQILQAAVANPNNNPSDVASIVDSVLAGLRPKLMEEISRKMAEKK